MSVLKPIWIDVGILMLFLDSVPVYPNTVCRGMYGSYCAKYGLVMFS